MIICKYAKNHNLTFEAFIEVLGKIALLIYTGNELCNDKSIAIKSMRNLLDDYIFKYLNNFCEVNNDLNINIDVTTKEILLNTYVNFNKIYKV